MKEASGIGGSVVQGHLEHSLHGNPSNFISYHYSGCADDDGVLVGNTLQMLQMWNFQIIVAVQMVVFNSVIFSSSFWKTSKNLSLRDLHTQPHKLATITSSQHTMACLITSRRPPGPPVSVSLTISYLQRLIDARAVICTIRSSCSIIFQWSSSNTFR